MKVFNPQNSKPFQFLNKKRDITFNKNHETHDNKKVFSNNRHNVLQKLQKSFNNDNENSRELIPRKIEYKLSCVLRDGKIQSLENTSSQTRQITQSLLKQNYSEKYDENSEIINNFLSLLPQVGKGFNNVGNTCFLNSTLQTLVYSEGLRNSLLLSSHASTCSLKQQVCFLCAYEKLVSQSLNIDIINMKKINNEKSSFTPMSIIQHIKLISKHIRIGRQEDSHEFLIKLLEAMEDSCIKDHKNKNKSFIQKNLDKENNLIKDLFCGVCASSVICGTCKTVSSIKDNYMSLSLVRIFYFRILYMLIL